MLGQMDLVLIGGAVLLLFGPKKLPDLMKGLGHGIKEFKKAQSDLKEEFTSAINTDDTPSKSDGSKK
ncbi:MAG: twin-arginine translocase TatA/TatE family subunit [Chlorobium sp.]|jgi:sec-independent protein translocase protein TatA|nr:MAG: twin-arginine translocase TatA/TatE family subunit [Chlorobium sp.]